MTWNWQQPDWPRWHFDAESLAALESAFLLGAGRLMGAWRHLADDERDRLTVDLLSDEALKTSQIEGELLDRVSVQSSLRREFGLTADQPSKPAESGIAEMMVSCFRHFDEPLSHEMLHGWHRLLCRGRNDLRVVGAYRSHAEPMQVVSGAIHRPKVHFEAPPAARMADEMSAFIDWFEATGAGGRDTLPALTRAGLAHLYFVSIHPYEDGNGRIARALCEKALAQALGQPSLLSLSRQIERERTAYYGALAANNRELEVSDWLRWFARAALDAQAYPAALIDHLIAKTRLFDRLRGQLNPRQQKVLLRLFDAGPEGFSDGLSAGNYIALTRASPATARRDLVDLVAKGALLRTGERKSTRYWLPAAG